MTKAKPLTPKQKQIAREKSDTMFAEQITSLPGMEGTTKRQIAMYLRNPAINLFSTAADSIEAVISVDGLPSQYSEVMDYLKYLRAKA